MSRELGALAEAQAESYLKGLGWKILAKNFTSKIGEIDLIAQDGEVVVFVEVRSRSGADFGAPEETISAAKRRRIIKTAQFYIARRALDCETRFDVVAIEGGKLSRIESAFDATGFV